MSQEEPKKRGSRPIYEVSPFVPNVKVRTKKVTNKRGDMMLVSSETGEIAAPIAGFWEAKEVDDEAFVKLFVNGVKALAELSPAGTKAFSVLYEALQSAIGKDRVYVSFNTVDQNKIKMSRATFTRGFTELVERIRRALRRSKLVFHKSRVRLERRPPRIRSRIQTQKHNTKRHKNSRSF